MNHKSVVELGPAELSSDALREEEKPPERTDVPKRRKQNASCRTPWIQPRPIKLHLLLSSKCVRDTGQPDLIASKGEPPEVQQLAGRLTREEAGLRGSPPVGWGKLRCLTQEAWGPCLEHWDSGQRDFRESPPESEGHSTPASQSLDPGPGPRQTTWD